MLTERLKRVMDRLVADNQTALIKGRQMFDAALAASEYLDYYLRKAKRAYVNWSFSFTIQRKAEEDKFVWPQKTLWKTKAPTKVACFERLAAHGVCLDT